MLLSRCRYRRRRPIRCGQDIVLEECAFWKHSNRLHSLGKTHGSGQLQEGDVELQGISVELRMWDAHLDRVHLSRALGGVAETDAHHQLVPASKHQCRKTVDQISQNALQRPAGGLPHETALSRGQDKLGANYGGTAQVAVSRLRACPVNEYGGIIGNRSNFNRISIGGQMIRDIGVALKEKELYAETEPNEKRYRHSEFTNNYCLWITIQFIKLRLLRSNSTLA